MILAKKEVEIDDVEQEIQSVGEDEENVEIENIEGKVIFNHLTLFDTGSKIYVKYIWGSNRRFGTHETPSVPLKIYFLNIQKILLEIGSFLKVGFFVG